MSGNKVVLALRWIARIASLLSISVLSLFLFGGGEEQRILQSMEVIGFLFFPVCVASGFLVSWRYELVGSIISMVGLCGFYGWHLARSGDWPTGPWFLIFASPAIGFLVVSLLASRD